MGRGREGGCGRAGARWIMDGWAGVGKEEGGEGAREEGAQCGGERGGQKREGEGGEAGGARR
jgi:hypothetical protein